MVFYFEFKTSLNICRKLNLLIDVGHCSYLLLSVLKNPHKETFYNSKPNLSTPNK